MTNQPQTPATDPVDGWSVMPNWVVRTDILKGWEKWVFTVLLNRANSRGETWPSLALITREVGCSKRTVLRALERLEEVGVVEKIARRNPDGGTASNMYRVHVWNPEGGCHRAPGGVPQSTRGGATEHQEVLPIEVLPIEGTPVGGASAGSGTVEDTVPTPQEITRNIYDRVNGAINFAAVMGIVKWATDTRGEDTQRVEDACVALYDAGRPITRQTLGQMLDGRIGQSATGGHSQNAIMRRMQEQARAESAPMQAITEGRA